MTAYSQSALVATRNALTCLILASGAAALATATMAAEESATETGEESVLEVIAELVGTFTLDVCPSAATERAAISASDFFWSGSTELYLYGCSFGILVPEDDRYDVCREIPEMVLNDPVTSVHVPLHEWEKRGAMEEAERLVALGCVDGALEASEFSDEPGNEGLRDFREEIHKNYDGQPGAEDRD